MFWDEEALRFCEFPTGAHSDPYLVELENWFITKYLEKFRPRRLLDIGCGNGQRTKVFSRYSEDCIGIDGSENMIKLAKNLENDNLHFYKEDILSPDWHIRYGVFDCVTSCRCLINLGTLQNQIRAIDALAKLLPKGGLFVFCEGSKNGTERLNSLREKFGLGPIRTISVNLDLEEDIVLNTIQSKFNIIQMTHFGTYYMLTRVYYPAVISPEKPNPNSMFNQIAAKMENGTEDPLSDLLGRHLCMAVQKL